MATIIAFPQYGSFGNSEPEVVSADTDRSNQIVVKAPRSANPRFRGLHLTTAADTPVVDHRQSTQAQARRIVAQVEGEIERQAARQHSARLNNPAPVLSHSWAQTEIETPATVAKRLFAALLSFARPA